MPNEKKIICWLPKNIQKNVNRKRQDNPRDWTNIFMYSNQRQKLTYGEDFKVCEAEPIIDGGQSYNKNTLYKDHLASNKDDLFDYYKILKTDKKRKNYIKKRKKAKVKKELTNQYGYKIIEGKTVVKF